MEELIEIQGLNFETITFSQATQVALQGVAPIAKTAFRYYLGDHWGPNGEGWMGPRPPEDEPETQELMAQIRRAFVSKNTVKEVVGRHRSGVLGKEPSWGFTVTRALARDEEPTQEEQDLIDEMEAALTEWWDEREAHRLLQVAVEALLCAGKSTLRLFIPPGKLKSGELPTGLTLAQALNLIFLGVPKPEQAGTYTDPDMMEDIGVYTYTRNGIGQAEVSYLAFPESPNEPPVTILRTLSVQSDQQQSGATSPQAPQTPRQPQLTEAPPPGFVEMVELDLNGHILIYEMNRDPLVSPQVVQNQDLLNMALTMLGRNAVQGGFLERIFLNAEEPSETTTEYNSVTGQNDDVEVAQPLQVGPGRSTFVQGRTYKDEVSGEEKIATPSVVFRDPVEVGTFIQTKEEAYRNILEETHQLHALLAGDAAATGISRVMARTDFLDDLKLSAPIVQKALRWLLETALFLAAEISGDVEQVRGLRASVAVKLDPGPMTPEERASIQALYAANMISLEDALVLLGFDDVDAIIARLNAEIETSLEAWEKRAQILQILTQFMDVEVAAEVIGISEEIARKMGTSVVVEGPEESPAPEPEEGADEQPVNDTQEGKNDGEEASEEGDNPFGQ